MHFFLNLGITNVDRGLGEAGEHLKGRRCLYEYSIKACVCICANVKGSLPIPSFFTLSALLFSIIICVYLWN